MSLFVPFFFCVITLRGFRSFFPPFGVGSFLRDGLTFGNWDDTWLESGIGKGRIGRRWFGTYG